MPATPDSHVRVNFGILALAEKRALVWIAARLPRWMNSDHLTVLGLAGMIGTGAAFWASAAWPPALLLAIPALAINWFGDSLDGTVARVRHHERPRYGYYLDHVLDVSGITVLMAGMGTSGVMSPLMSLAVLAAYLLVSAEVFLATAVRGEFRMSFLNLGPTELRIALAAGTLVAYFNRFATPFGFGPYLLFDLGGCGAVAGLIAAFVTSAARNVAALYREERLPRPSATIVAVFVVIVLTGLPRSGSAATLSAQTLEAWKEYVAAAELRIGREEANAQPTPACGPIEGSITSIPGGLIHQWRGCIFLPRVMLDGLLTDLQHPTSTWPQQADVLALRVLERRPDWLRVSIKMTRSKLVTVTYNTEHDVTYRRQSPTRASSRSVATHIAEIEDAASPVARERPPGQDRGFMWRLNSYWRYEQRPGGVLVHLESLTLSRDVPRGFGFIVQPFIASVARESMERTLQSIANPPSRSARSRSAG